MQIFRALVLSALSFLAARVFAATYAVDSLADLQSRINAAVPGDTITLKDGVYTTTVAITVNRTATMGQPITISAQTTGGVELRGSAGFKFEKPAAYITIQGFKFTHAGTIVIPTGTSHCRLSRNIIELAIPADGNVPYLNISGDDAEIDRNELRNKSTLGNMISVTGAGSQVARRLWIHHNYFHDFAHVPGNGAETIRFGLSGLSMSTGTGLVEHNLFVRCVGENELISNQSCGNTYRYNTFLDSPGAELSQRHGNDCLIYGNYFRNTQGIRFSGDRHQIFSNYLESNSIGITVCNGDGEVATGSQLTCHDRPDDCVVSFNTLINNKINFQMGGRTNGLGATNTTFANNIVQGGGKAADISSTAPYPGAVWSGNLIWKTAGAGAIPDGGCTTADPLLVADANGIFHLSSGSPAIDSAVGNFPAVTFDLDGQPRIDPKDKGADEFLPKAPIAARLLTPSDVGPNSK